MARFHAAFEDAERWWIDQNVDSCGVGGIGLLLATLCVAGMISRKRRSNVWLCWCRRCFWRIVRFEEDRRDF